jgi:hypothetical protein
MKKTLVALTFGIIFILAASMVWADQIDKEIERQQSVITQGLAAGKIDSWDGSKLQHNLDRIKRSVQKYRDKGRYTPQAIQKFEVHLQRSNNRIQEIMARAK